MQDIITYIAEMARLREGATGIDKFTSLNIDPPKLIPFTGETCESVFLN